ncbi:MAG: 3-dehydroquinate synthase [Bacteroidetes bacterium]|nr:3-dehydroquinate synthase [Bacteroidota bacterium]
MLADPVLPPHLFFSTDLGVTLAAWQQEVNPSACFLVADAQVARLHAAEVSRVASLCQASYTVPSGEVYKTLETTQALWRFLLDNGADRKALVFAIGGGVVTDMTAFAASTYMRGVRFILCPTTLLSQVDASMGGKTGIDFAGGKNLVGTFAEPEAVVIGPHFLDTLPPRELLSGYAEVLKHGLIADAAYWHTHKQISPQQADASRMVQQSIALKHAVVQKDPREQGLRKTLNFGHTLGHAIESVWLETDTPLLHGEAVALGMQLAAELSVELTGLSVAERDDICLHLRQLGFPGPEKLPEPEALFHYLRLDKKNRQGELRFSLLNRIGQCLWDVAVPPKLVQDLLLRFPK